jgi:hypothetical protein
MQQLAHFRGKPLECESPVGAASGSSVRRVASSQAQIKRNLLQYTHHVLIEYLDTLQDDPILDLTNYLTCNGT